MLIGNGLIHPATSTGGAKDNAIDIGGASNRFKDLYLSSGVFLGGTGAANKLDDVETGTFTMTVNGASGHNTTAHYTKIGNKVTFQYYTGAATFTAVQAKFSGLPFTTSSSSQNYATFYSAHNTAVTNAFTGYFSLNSTTGYFVNTNSTTTPNYNAGGLYFMVSGHYFTD